MDTLKNEISLMFSNPHSRLNVIRYFSFQGFAYFMLLISAIISLTIGSFIPVLYAPFAGAVGLILLIVFVLNIIWTIRRLHDINFSGYWILIPFLFLFLTMVSVMLPFPKDSIVQAVLVFGFSILGGLSQLALFVLMFFPGTQGVNQYGEEPPPNNALNYIFMVIFFMAMIVLGIANIFVPNNSETPSAEPNLSSLRQTINQKLSLARTLTGPIWAER